MCWLCKSVTKFYLNPPESLLVRAIRRYQSTCINMCVWDLLTFTDYFSFWLISYMFCFYLQVWFRVSPSCSHSQSWGTPFGIFWHFLMHPCVVDFHIRTHQKFSGLYINNYIPVGASHVCFLSFVVMMVVCPGCQRPLLRKDFSGPNLSFSTSWPVV